MEFYKEMFHVRDAKDLATSSGEVPRRGLMSEVTLLSLEHTLQRLLSEAA